MKLQKLTLLLLLPLALSACSLKPKEDNREKAFLISLTNDENTKIVLSQRQDFTIKEESLYILSEGFPKFCETSYSFLPDFEFLDNEQTTYDLGAVSGEDPRLFFFKYTFYVKNNGNITVDYLMTINFSEEKSGPVALSDVVRLMVFENTASSNSHDYSVYAKRSMNTAYDKDGNKTDREFISVRPNSEREDDEHPLAMSFIDTNRMYESTVRGFNSDDAMRYTVVLWLEGEDPEAFTEVDQPLEGSLKLKVDIEAVEAN